MTKTVSSSYDDAPTILENTKTITNPLLENQFKSYCKLFSICTNAALSSFFIGYSLVVIGAIDFQYIVKIYGLEEWDNKIAESVINGAVPIGGIFGALLSSQLLTRFSRRNGFLVTNALGLLCLVLIFIKTSATLLIGRILQGICTGIFSAIVPLYINEIVTPDSANLGSLNQVLISSAQGFAFLWYFILSKIFVEENGLMDYYTVWNMLSLFLLIPICLQTVIFIFVFPYDTPKYLYEQGLNRKAAELIAKIYKEEYVEQAISRLEVNRGSVHSDRGDRTTVKEQIVGIAGTNKYVNNKIAIFFAIHLALLQQMSGVNAIVVYGKQTLNHVIKDNQDLIDLCQVMIASLPAVMAAFSITLMKKKGRKFIIQMGTLAVIICLATVIVAIFLSSNKEEGQENLIASIFVIAAMAIYMAFFGLTLGPIVWLYIPQIVQPNIIPYSTTVNFSGAGFCIIVFPLMKNHNIIAFSIFLAWTAVSFLINAKFMVETKDKSRRKVFSQYKQMKLC